MSVTNITLNTDNLLWEITIHGNRQAFRLLFEYYYTPLCLYAKRFIEEKAVREDIVQDVFFSLWEKKNKIAINTSAKNYLITCVKNNSLNYLRKQGYLEEYQNKVIEKEDEYSEYPEDLYSLHELQELLDKTLEKLPEEYRIAFIMSRMEDKNSTEIAETLGVSVRTVERYRNKAIEILKTELKDFLPLSLLAIYFY